MSADVSSKPAPAAAPPHVPPHLVRQWSFADAEGAKDDPYAASRTLYDGPGVIYSPLMGHHGGDGAWVITRSEFIREIYQDTETFTNRDITGFAKLIGETWRLLPVEVDPPEHGKYRMLLNPLFTPAKIAGFEDGIRVTARELIQGLVGKGRCDFEPEFGRVFPVSIFLRLMGLPLEDADQMVEWENGLLHSPTLEDKRHAAKAVRDYLAAAIAERRAEPRDDLISFTISRTVDERPISDDDVLGICYLLYLAGLDTVTAVLGHVFGYLATHPEDQARLRRDPELIPNAVEEMLRAFAVVSSGRHVARDVVFHGAPMKAGDRIILPTPLSGRDPNEYDAPDRIDFGRENVRHITFGAGPHRCLGSHLARREIRIAVEEWLRLVPSFGVTPGEKVVNVPDGIWGVPYLPLSWTPPGAAA